MAIQTARRGAIAANRRRTPNPYLDFDWDVSETQAFTHPSSTYQLAQAHQKAWLTTPTRLGAGHSERLEVHNNSGDLFSGAYFLAAMVAADTNDGGISTSTVTGYPEVYWAWSSYLPTFGVDPTNAEVTSGFKQNQVPDYQHLFELHERNNITSILSSEVANHAVMVELGKLRYRSRCGTWTWNGSGYNAPAVDWNSGVITNGSGVADVPIVKSSGTNATMVTDVWIDVVLHARFATDSSGLVEIWARQAGQAFTSSPQLSVTGPNHKLLTGGPSDPRSSADIDPGSSPSASGHFLICGLYSGSPTWSDSNNSAQVHIMDELRRWGSVAEAKANWG